MAKIKELIRIYKTSESPLEKANIWSHILEIIDEVTVEKNPDEFSDSLYWNEEDSISLENKREAYKRGYIQAINDLL